MVSEKGFAVIYGVQADSEREANEKALDQLHEEIGGLDYDVLDVKVADDGPYSVELDVVVREVWDGETRSVSRLFSNAETFQEIAVEDPDKIAGEEERVRECPDCGERLQPITGFDIAGPGELHSYIYCPDCGFRGRETWKIAETRRSSHHQA